MDDAQCYQQVDLPFYRQEVAPLLPQRVLDFHAHTWTRAQWKVVPWQTDAAGARYMVTDEDYPIEQLGQDGRALFPDRDFQAVCFGNPTPAADLVKTNAYLARAGGKPGLFPLMVVGRDGLPCDELERRVLDGGFFGFKVRINWYGNNYGKVRVEDMIGPTEMALADRMGLVVLLHVPGAGRLADPAVQEGVRRLASEYPGAALVLAHCGRAYLPDEMEKAVGAVSDLRNVFLDTAMVMDPTVLQIVLERIGAHRVLFATDLPVARMRGRRVYAMDHWVDVVLPGYPVSQYRTVSSDMRATFMVYEIVLAIARAARRAGVGPDQLARVFHDNGAAILQRVRGGEAWRRAQEGWQNADVSERERPKA